MLIDLDAPPPAARPRPDRRPRALKAGAWVVAGLLTLLLGGAAVPPAQPLLTLVASTAGRPSLGTLMSATTLFVERRDVSATRSTVSLEAVPLAPGARPWTFRFAGTGAGLTLDQDGNVLVVASDSDETFYLDAATGAVRLHGWVAANAVAGGRALVLERGRLRLIDLASGRTRWSLGADEEGPVSTDAAGPYAVAVDGQGWGVVHATADGRVVGRGDLGVSPDVWDNLYPEPFAALQVDGETLYVYGTTFVAAYGLPDLRLKWRTRPKVLPVLVRDCGSLLCVRDETGVTVLDPATGRTLWSNVTWRLLTDDGLAVTSDGRAVRLDLTTGRVVRELGNGNPTGRLMIVDEGNDRVSVTDLGSGRLLGRLTGVTPQGCVSRGDYLSCIRAGATVAVWRVPPAR